MDDIPATGMLKMMMFDWVCATGSELCRCTFMMCTRQSMFLLVSDFLNSDLNAHDRLLSFASFELWLYLKELTKCSLLFGFFYVDAYRKSRTVIFGCLRSACLSKCVDRSVDTSALDLLSFTLMLKRTLESVVDAYQNLNVC